MSFLYSVVVAEEEIKREVKAELEDCESECNTEGKYANAHVWQAFQSILPDPKSDKHFHCLIAPAQTNSI